MLEESKSTGMAVDPPNAGAVEERSRSMEPCWTDAGERLERGDGPERMDLLAENMMMMMMVYKWIG